MNNMPRGIYKRTKPSYWLGRKKCKESIEKRTETRRANGNYIAWNKGKTGIYSEKTLQKMSESRSGKRLGHTDGFKKGHMPWNKGKKLPHFSGKNHPRWTGYSTWAELIRKSLEYKQWRKSVFERDDYRCRDCGIKGGKLEADHIYPFAKYPRLRFVLENGRTLCRDCHRKTDTYGNNNKRDPLGRFTKTTQIYEFQR